MSANADHPLPDRPEVLQSPRAGPASVPQYKPGTPAWNSTATPFRAVCRAPSCRRNHTRTTGGSALAEALHEPFKFTVIALLPDRWEMNFEEVGIALCRTLTEEPDRLDRVLSHLESAVLDEFVGCQERNEPLNPADLSESIVAAIAGMLREAFSMSRAYAASLVERHYTGLHAPA